jgi:type IV secretory pathway TraG/TraD family ATPase VirD4
MQVLFGLAGSTIVIPEVPGDETHLYQPERVLTLAYTAHSLADLLYATDNIFSAVLMEAQRKLSSLTGEAAAQLNAGLRYFTTEYQATLLTARGETLGSVRASVSPHLRALTAPAFAESFGSGDIDLAAAIDSGAKIIVDVDQAENPAGFAAVAALMEAHMGRIALTRTGRDPAKNTPCLLLLDEAATYLSAQSIGIFETCRQARICSVVSIIGLSNLQARLGDAAAYSIPSALGSMVTFATGDGATRKYVTDRIGTVRVLEITEGSSSSPHPQTPFVSSMSASSSEHYVSIPVIDDECWSHLGVHADRGYASAIAILAQGGQIAHDVIMVPGE